MEHSLKKTKEDCFGVCPVCGNENDDELEYNSLRFSDYGNSVYCFGVCNKCGAEFKEIFKYSHSEHD